MKSNLNRNRLVHLEAQVLHRLLKGFAQATAMRKNPRAARPAVANTARVALLDPQPVDVHGPSRPPLGLQPAIVDGPSRVRPDLQPAVKHPCQPGHHEQPRASRPCQKSSLSPAPRQGAVCCQLSGLHNRERAREANPLISAGLSSSLTPSSVPHVQKAEPRKSEATSDVIKSVNAARSITKQARETVRTGDRKL